jgi:hypothetical protein
MTVRSELQAFVESKEDPNEKAFLESWLQIYDIVEELQGKYMRIRSAKASRVINAVINFTCKFHCWIDYRLPQYKDIPWYTYVQVIMLDQKFSIDDIKSIGNELETSDQRLKLGHIFKNLTATLNTTKSITN